MRRLFRVDGENIRPVRITPAGKRDWPELAFAHDSDRIPIDSLVLAGWPDYLRTDYNHNPSNPLQGYEKIDRKTFMKSYEFRASKHPPDVIFVVGKRAFDSQGTPRLMFPIVPFRVIEGRKNTHEYKDVNRLFFHYDSKTGKVACSVKNFSWIPPKTLPFPKRGCDLDPADLYLLTEPIMHCGKGSIMASQAPEGMDLGAVTLYNRKEFWIDFLKGEVNPNPDNRNEGVPEDIGIEKVVRILGSTDGDSLFAHAPIVRFGYIPRN